MKTTSGYHKLKALLFVLMASVVAFATVSVPRQAFAGGITIDGNASDWAGIPNLATNTGTANVLKATHDDRYLYLFVQGSGMSTSFGNFWMDSDNNISTGYHPSNWGPSGVEWLLENNGLWRYSGTGADWSWNYGLSAPNYSLSAGQFKRTSTMIEAAIPLSSLQMNSGDTIRIGYIDNGSSTNRLPQQNASLTAYQLKRQKIHIDGNVQDWAAISPLAVNSGTVQTLKMTNDAHYLYLLVQGSNLSQTFSNFWLNTDGNVATGFLADGWAANSTGVEWLLENDKLWKYTGSGGDWNWNNGSTSPNALLGANYYRNSSVIEAAIPLQDLQIQAGNVISAGFIDHGSTTNRLPSQGSALSSYALLKVTEPTELTGPLSNPFKGWAPPAVMPSYPQPHKLVYAGPTWKELEPVKGVIDWATFEQTYQIDMWKSQGVKFVFRLVLDFPTGTPNRDIPDWLYNDMVALGQSPGTAYQDLSGGLGTGTNTGFSPNYESSYLIARHKMVLDAIADRYGTMADSPIAFIQLGSIGHWGEFHTWPDGTGVFPSPAITNQYIQQYLDAFGTESDKMLMTIRRNIPLATNNGIGMHNDVFGLKESYAFPEWYSAVGSQFWETAAVGGEFGYGLAGTQSSLTSGPGFDESMRELILSKTSWLGPASPAGLPLNNPLQSNMDKFLNKMGYHFVVREVSHPATIPSNALAVEVKVENKGVHAFLFNWPVELQLRNSSDMIVSRKTAAIDLRNWNTGLHDLKESFTIPQNLPSGTYRIVIAILNPGTGAPAVDFANAGRTSDGGFQISTVVK